MLERIKRLLGPPTSDEGDTPGERLRVATCVLFLEVAHADSEFQEAETVLIHDLLEKRFDLSSESADELITLAQQRRDATFDLYQFTKQINENFSLAEKLEMMEGLWRLVYADSVLDKFEDALMHQLATLLRLSHQQMIAMKVKVLDEMRPTR